MENKLVIACDHAGYELKQQLIGVLESFDLTDVGTYSLDSCDYPDFAHQLAEKISSGEIKRGILICGSANGVSMSANKHVNVRSAICWNAEIAELARLHNDANVLALPARYITVEEAKDIVNTFFNTEFEGGRHQTRVNKINC
ncbi:MAG: ribose 5-phosphate isomerase B [Flavobacteriales bacterium]|nr:ribose 5-phosphate isomerase B [Flavobacteriales bacterium]